MRKTTGTIFDIQRFSIHDGPGIRTTVFLKGCPLRCQWCHNPESWSAKPELAFDSALCLHCGACVPVCPQGAHVVKEGEHAFNRELCTGCGKCVEVCVSRALGLAGKEMTAEEVLDEVKKDMAFYTDSEGGMTLSGGEPLAQTEFSAEILSRAQAAGIHTAIETSGFAPPAKIKMVASHCNLILFDLKAAPEDYQRLTGRPFGQIEANLQSLSNMNIPIHLRLPLIPGINDTDTHFKSIRRILADYPSIEKAEVIPYHSLAAGKYQHFGCMPFTAETPGPSLIEEWETRIQ